MLQTVLEKRWKTNSEASYPFCKLKTLCLQNGVAGTILPGLEEKHLRRINCNPNDGPFLSPYSSGELGSGLRLLTLCSVTFSPQWLEGALSHETLRGLKQLRVQFAGSAYGWNDPWARYGMSRMSNAIVTSLPGLEVLEWSQHQWDKQWHTVSNFGSLSGLKQLTSLTVDYQLLVPTGNGSNGTPLHLLGSTECIPVGLQSLHLTNVMDLDVTSISD
jgi:hypothetical protein